MYADYQRLKSVAKVAALHGRSRQSIWDVFRSHDLQLQPKKVHARIVYAGRSFTPGKDGYFRATTGCRELLHHRIWIDLHGPIPRGYQVTFKNADNADFRQSNLTCLPTPDVTRLHASGANQFTPSVDRSRAAAWPKARVASPSTAPVIIDVSSPRELERSIHAVANFRKRAREGTGRPRIPDERVRQMYAAYLEHGSISAVARLFQRSTRSVGQIFARRGFQTKPGTNPNAKRLPNGQMAPAIPVTAGQVASILAAATSLSVPKRLALDWRKWSIARRADFIRTLRAKLASPADRPITPFSRNVVPFDYGTPRARSIMERLNAGTTSQTAVVKISICSQGVIWRNRLWFWSSKIGYQSGPWTPTNGRPALHHVIWEDHHGRHVPPGYVVIFKDRNRNNLSPSNLGLASRNDICRQNQAAALLRKSRDITKLLLQRSQTKHPRHGDTIITHLRPARRL
jgi:hypothetical protein